MAGYFRRTLEKVYEGLYKADVELTNGLFVKLTDGKVVLNSAAADTVMRVAEKTYLAGKPAIVADVVSVGEDEVYFVENEWDVEPHEDTSAYTVKVGERVKMKRPLPGEQIVLTVDETLYGNLQVGGLITPAADGLVAVKA